MVDPGLISFSECCKATTRIFRHLKVGGREAGGVKMTKTQLCAVATFAALVLMLTASLAAEDQGPHQAAQQYVWATASASPSLDPGFAGYWKYCITINWDITKYGGKPHGLSHISIVLGLENCPLVCRPGFFASAEMAGGGSGEGGCTAQYYFEFNCKGDPTIPRPVPTIKFEPYGACLPGIAGTANVCFYSLAQPRPAQTYTDAVWMKFGRNITAGPIEGMLPSCITPEVSVERSTWGAIKALFD